MPSKKQVAAAKKNVTKAQKAWKGMTKRERTLAQPEGRKRQKPGTGGAGKFYHIEIRPKGQFTSFRTQDVGKKGGLERIAGRRSSGSWATATWLIAKKNARVVNKKLVITNAKEKAALEHAIRGPITQVKGDIFHAHPAKNVPEKAKPTAAMKKAQSANIRKAQSARAKG
jgi:hypothetical protein